MTTQSELPTLASLDYLSYLDDNGSVGEDTQKKIGVYAIFDRDRQLQFVGYSRDIYLSLKQHLVRKPEACYWLKIETIDRPTRSILESIKQAWIKENGLTPSGNGEEEKIWTQPIDAKLTMTEEEKAQYQKSDELGRIKILKKIARRVEETIKEQLNLRGVNMDMRFNPKIKEQGLLDLK